MLKMGACITAIACLAFCLPYYSITAFLYITRRHRHPICSQWPRYNIAAMPFLVCMTLSGSLYSLARTVDTINFPYYVHDLISFTGCLGVATAMSMRCWTLYANYYLKHILLENQEKMQLPGGTPNGRTTEIDIKEFRTWGSMSPAWKFAHRFFDTGIVVVAAILVVAVWTGAAIFTGPNIGNEQAKTNPITNTSLMTIFTTFLLLFITFAVMISRVSKTEDRLNITRQLKFFSLATLTLGGSWWGLLMTPVGDRVRERTNGRFDLSNLLAVTYFVSCYTIVIVWPIVESFLYERTLKSKTSLSTTKESFELTLSDPTLCEEFRDFLKREFAIENILAYNAMCSYKRTLTYAGTKFNGDLAAQLARQIYYAHLDPDSLYEVNLPAQVTNAIRRVIFKSVTVPPRRRSSANHESALTVKCNMSKTEPTLSQPLFETSESQSSTDGDSPMVSAEDTKKEINERIGFVEADALAMEWIDLFDSAQKHLFYLMLGDSFPRFVARRNSMDGKRGQV